MPPEDTIYPTKRLRYQICKFFYDKRVSIPGLGGPFSVALRDDMRYLLEYAVGNNDDERKIALCNELHSLHTEWFDDSRRSVVDIMRLPSSEDFVEAFENNHTLQISCLSKDIEDYMLQLKGRTISAIKRNRPLKLENMFGGGVRIILRDNEMEVGKSKGNNIDLRVDVVKLIFGWPVSMPDGDISIKSFLGDYDRGDYVTVTDLLDILREIDGNGEESKLNLKSVKEEIGDLNKRAFGIFEHLLFGFEGTGVKWIL